MKRFLMALTIIAFMLDFASTELVITSGKGYESNQLYYFLGFNIFWLLFFFANTVILIYYLTVRDPTFRQSRFWAFIMDIVVLCFALFRLTSAFNNFHILF